MKRVFLSGPISKGSLAHNLCQFDTAAETLQRAGLAVFNPGLSVYQGGIQAFYQAYKGPTVRAVASAPGHQGFTHKQWVALCKAWIEVSDAVVRLPGVSVGADQEVVHAERKGVPVFRSVEEVIKHFQPRLPLTTQQRCPAVGTCVFGWEGGGCQIYTPGTLLHVTASDGEYDAAVERVWFGKLDDMPARMLARVDETYDSIRSRVVPEATANYHVRRRTA